MKFLQKLGKALMLPVAILPICGILMGIGYRLCPATMQVFPKLKEIEEQPVFTCLQIKEYYY